MPDAAWVDSHELVAHLTGEPSTSWWLFDLNGTVRRLTNPMDGFVRGADGRLLTGVGNQLMALDAGEAKLVPVKSFDGAVSIWWPLDSTKKSDNLLLALVGADNRTRVAKLSLVTGKVTGSFEPPTGFLGNMLDVSSSIEELSWSDKSQDGLVIKQHSLESSETSDLLELDTDLSEVEWGRTQAISYDTRKGQPVQGTVILPPTYVSGRRYPMLVWVYGGYMSTGTNDYWTDPFLPGLYNLQLYAAQGYVVLIPSMPLPSRSERADVYDALPDGVLPAVDKLIALGIADPKRVGVMGQSFGGYSVYGLVTQTDRFKAAVAIAGITDLRAHFGDFDPLASGYVGIDQEKSDNWAEMDLWGRHTPPVQDERGYETNSPITYVDRVQTPLLMVHGTLDDRGSIQQAEEFFYGLYAQGKTAKLLRYGGESHSIAQSPANVRDAFHEIVAWFDKYLH